AYKAPALTIELQGQDGMRPGRIALEGGSRPGASIPPPGGAGQPGRAHPAGTRKFPPSHLLYTREFIARLEELPQENLGRGSGPAAGEELLDDSSRERSTCLGGGLASGHGAGGRLGPAGRRPGTDHLDLLERGVAQAGAGRLRGGPPGCEGDPRAAHLGERVG